MGEHVLNMHEELLKGEDQRRWSLYMWGPVRQWQANFPCVGMIEVARKCGEKLLTGDV